MTTRRPGQPQPGRYRIHRTPLPTTWTRATKKRYAPAMVGIRNPKAHELSRGDDPDEALEALALASLLHRRLDIAEERLD